VWRLMAKIRNWDEFQHFKDRTPPWIKLYRYLLDDPEWHDLSGDDSKVLVMLWLIASEDKAMEGNLPNSKILSFRLRISETKLNQSLTKLSHWLIIDDIDVISDCNQTDAPEERQRQRQRQSRDMALVDSDFDIFYKSYPKKKNRGDAEKAWNKIKPDIDLIMKALDWQKSSRDWVKDNGQFIPYPASYLNSKGWLDEPILNNEKSTPDWKRGLI